MWSPHQTCFRYHRSYALWVQISLPFALKATVTEIRAKIEKSKMAAGGHLECGLHTKHVLGVIGLYALWVQISLRFALKATVTEIRAKIEKSKMAAGGHLECGLHTKHVLGVIGYMPCGSKFHSVSL